MTPEITIGLTIIGCVLIFAPIHWAHVDSKRRMKADHAAEVQDLRDWVTFERETSDERGKADAAILADRDQQLRDANNMLTAETARADFLAAKLEQVAAQVKGRALFPTLAADDVVIDLADRRAR